jgi:hypothetical protein
MGTRQTQVTITPQLGNLELADLQANWESTSARNKLSVPLCRKRQNLRL